MITYEKALELKNAGFEQKKNRIGFLNTFIDNEGNLITEGESVYYPSLEELIEACVGRFVLHSPNSCDVNEYYWQNGDKWLAFHQGDKDKETRGEGSTSSEAVANLWLELNKK
jgi:hypothetical protein